tara:strand:+ start:350 stop:697 length:348 start_codon:yes stop_codon:yes gene_type:complete
MVAGHPFKGGLFMSTGYLTHPDMKRFALNDSTLFVPPRPNVWASAMGIGLPPVATPSFNDFFGTYFAGRQFGGFNNVKCNTMFEGMKRCYENHADAAPAETCNFYIQGFERMGCQ